MRAPGRVDSRLRGNDEWEYGHPQNNRHPGRNEVETRDLRAGGTVRVSLKRAPGRVDSRLRGNDEWEYGHTGP